MPRLSELTDNYYNDPMGAAPVELPVEKPFADLKKVYITGEEPKELPVKFSEEPQINESSPLSNNIDKFLNSIFRSDEKRLQLWPEKMLRHGVTAAGDVASGKVPTMAIDPVTGDVHTSPEMIEKAQEVAALAGTGGLASGGGSLNVTPSLRPALKYKDKLYKGKPGQEHMDVIPADIYPTFQKQAMSGEDISNFNFGFINDKGHFLSREDALKYGIDNGLIDPQAGKYGALTSTLFADSSKPGVAIEAMKTANPFFSALEHNVGKISQGKMTGDQWLGTLSNKPGVKPEEMQWTGLSDFLAENKGKPVTKAQIEEHLVSNKVELKEVTKGGEAGTKEAAFNLAKEHGWKSWDEIDAATQAKYMQRASKEAGENPTKYHSYQLPGGENYREMLLTLPLSKTSQRANAIEQELNEIFARKPRNSTNFATPEDTAAFARLTQEQSKLPKDKFEGNYQSSHWNEPNILAHVRMNDRTIDGKKSLHLEEIQSDWHQQGRDKGYKVSETEKNKMTKELEDVQAERAKLVGSKEPASRARYDELQNKEVALIDKYNALVHDGVPDAPFKKSWHELALKRMLREASEKGYDRLSWTPGEAQAARYDLSKSVDKVNLVPSDGKLRIDAFKDNHKVMEHFAKDESEVAAVVGKEVAKKLFETRNNHGASTLAGQDLKIGGEGMKGFYDQIIPKSLEKLGKEHGVKIKKSNVDTDRPGYDIISKDGRASYATYKGPPTEAQLHQIAKQEGVPFESLTTRKNKGSEAPVYYIDIPQSLKDTATQKGFPLFSKGGYMFQPVDFNPFEGKTELKT